MKVVRVGLTAAGCAAIQEERASSHEHIYIS